MFVFRNSIGFGQHHRLMVELDNIDFGNGGGNGSGTNANNNQGNGGGTDNNNGGDNGSGDNKDGEGKDGEGNNKDNPEPNNANNNPHTYTRKTGKIRINLFIHGNFIFNSSNQSVSIN